MTSKAKRFYITETTIDNYKTIVIHETNLQSITSDCFTMFYVAILFFSFYFNYRFCGASILLNLLLFSIAFLYIFSLSRKKAENMTKAELIEYITSL